MKYNKIIIDGYNFLKTTGILDLQVADGELEKGRDRLIQLLVGSFPEAEDRQKITLVFDSATRLNLPVEMNVKQISVRFARGYESADELIIELIRACSVPKRLLVVSSDHEIQIAAKRRRADYIDSDHWLDELEKQQQNTKAKFNRQCRDKDTKPEIENSRYWKEIFEDMEPLDEQILSSSGSPESEFPFQQVSEEQVKGDEEKQDRESRSRPFPPGRQVPKDLGDQQDKDLDNPFPPGYGEDILG